MLEYYKMPIVEKNIHSISPRHSRNIAEMGLERERSLFVPHFRYQWSHGKNDGTAEDHAGHRSNKGDKSKFEVPTCRCLKV